MRKTDLYIVAASGLLIALGASFGTARAQPSPPVSDATAKVYGSSREYRWTFYVPVMTLERREIFVQAPATTVRSRRWDYEVPGLRAERFKLGQVAEFTCKYMDWRLPNECRTVWHDVYADLPVLTMQKRHVDYDVAEWGWEERRIRFDVPRWTWTEQTLIVAVPAFDAEEVPPPGRSQAKDVVLARESIERARAMLDSREAATVKIMDDAIAALNSSIASVEAEGADPRKLMTVEGTNLDLGAARQALLDQKAQELDRFARLRGELVRTMRDARALSP
ncbi:MAG TPA: hypothetical protein VGR65_14015 [Casimicrobiaceae bacterium]|jgi:hypothetical protein|nr:hypothetical protein [Casimicrobiaceae bacterium]